MAGEGLGLGIGVFRFAESGLEEGGAWDKLIRAGRQSVGWVSAPCCANLGPICGSTARSMLFEEEEGCKLSERRWMIELWVWKRRVYSLTLLRRGKNLLRMIEESMVYRTGERGSNSGSSAWSEIPHGVVICKLESAMLRMILPERQGCGNRYHNVAE